MRKDAADRTIDVVIDVDAALAEGDRRPLVGGIAVLTTAARHVTVERSHALPHPLVTHRIYLLLARVVSLSVEARGSVDRGVAKAYANLLVDANPQGDPSYFRLPGNKAEIRIRHSVLVGAREPPCILPDHDRIGSVLTNVHAVYATHPLPN